MKRFTIPVILLAMLFMTGCLVSSLHPFYKTKDKVYDPVMEGNWIDRDSCIWTIEPNEVSPTFMSPAVPDSIMIYWYGEDWLNELFEQNRIRINHETVEAPDYDRHLLTASTD